MSWVNLCLFEDQPPELLQVHPVVDYTVRGLCLKPYPGNPKGCPNFNDPKHAHRCPPNSPLFDKAYDLSSPVYAVVGSYNVSERAAELQALHPTWSQKQCRCSRYWQNTARAQLRQEAREALQQLPEYEICECPEGMGIDVTETMRQVGIELWPFQDIDRHVFFLAKPLKHE